MAQMIIKLSQMILFGFLLQNVLSEKWSYNLWGYCYQKQNENYFPRVKHFQTSSQFGIVVNKTQMNLTIPEEFWEGDYGYLESDRFELLRQQLGRGYSIENVMVPWWYETETKSVLLHLKKNNQNESGQTILYATRKFEPVYNLDASKFDFSKRDFLVDESCPTYDYYFSMHDSPLCFRANNSSNELYFEPYNKNGYLNSFRIIYEENLAIKCIRGEEHQI